jgi:hypothetical protein
LFLENGSAALAAVTLRLVEQVSALAAASPAPDHHVGLWLRPLVAKRLTAERITTLGELIAYCNSHGGSWWRSVPRIGVHRARVLVAWLRRHEQALGIRIDADVGAGSPAPAVGLGHVVVVGGSIDAPLLAPFERLAIPTALSGEHGTNRVREFAFIRADHDLAAMHAYLNRYRDRPPTLRAYIRELERLVLWLVIVRSVALSSMTVEDGEAYKDYPKTPIRVSLGQNAPGRAGGDDVCIRQLVGRQSSLRGARHPRGVCMADLSPLSGRQSVEHGVRSCNHHTRGERAGRTGVTGGSLVLFDINASGKKGSDHMPLLRT